MNDSNKGLIEQFGETLTLCSSDPAFLNAVRPKLKQVAEKIEELEQEEDQDPILRLYATKPKAVRTAAFSLLFQISSELEDMGCASASFQMRRAVHGDTFDLEQQDNIAQGIELLGSFAGLCTRLPALKGPKFVSVLLDCISLASRIGSFDSAASPVREWSVQGLRKDLAAFIRTELKGKKQ